MASRVIGSSFGLASGQLASGQLASGLMRSTDPCYNFLYGFKGAPAARQADWPQPIPAKDARDEHGKRERAGSAAPWRQRVLGNPAAGGGAAWPASYCAIAHRRGPLPTAPMPRTPPQPAPAVTRRRSRTPRASQAVVTRQVGQPSGESPRHRAGTPRIVRVGPSSLNCASHPATRDAPLARR